VRKWLSLEQPFDGAPSIGKSIVDLRSVTTVGLDLAKQVFRVHGVEASGRVVIAKAMRRNKLMEFLLRGPPALARGQRIGASLGARVDQAWP
jgi:transposase